MKTQYIKLLTIAFFVLHYTSRGAAPVISIYNPIKGCSYFTTVTHEDDSITVCENSGATKIAVEGTDSGSEKAPVIVVGPKNGTASVTGKSISYTPNNGFAGRDTIVYGVCDTGAIVSCTTDSLFIVVDPAPVVVTGAGQTICYGDTIPIGGAPVVGDIYAWTPDKGLSSYTISNPKASPSDTTTYVLKVTNSTTGCTSTDSVVIIVRPVPEAFIVEGDTAMFCKGQPINLTASSGSSYLWSNGDTTKTITADSGDVYSVGITYSNGCTDYSAPTLVLINPLPVANAGRDTTICSGDSVTIGTMAGTGMSYKWAPSTGLNYDTIAQPKASPTVTTTYVLTVTDTIKGCQNTDTIIVTVVPQPIANAGPDKTICNGDTTTIGTVAVIGVSYKWAPSAGLSSTTIAQPNATPSVTTIYTLTASNGTCSNTDTVTVTVVPQPIASAGPDKTICKSDSVIIGMDGVTGMTYKWSPSSGLSSDTVAEPNASPSVTTTYILTVSNGTCSNEDTVVVTVLPQPVANAGPDKTICKGDSSTIGTVAISGTAYSWSPSTGLNSSTVAQPYASPTSTTTYVVTASNGTCSNKDTVVVTVVPKPTANAGSDKSICKGDSVMIGNPGIIGVTYKWSPSNGLSNDSIAQPNASPSVTTEYVLTASNGVCNNTDSVHVTVVPQPIANAGPDKTVCRKDSVLIGTAAVSGTTYTWSPASGLSSTTLAQPNASPASTTTYTLIASNGTCSNRDSVVINVIAQPVANAGSNETICKGDSVTIGSAATAGVSYKWSPSAGLSSDTVAQPNASPSVTTVYILTVTNQVSGCKNTDTTIVTVRPLPVANTGPSKNVCKGDSVTIGTASVTGVTYNWSPVTGLNSSTIAQPDASPTVTTTYTLTASNGTCNNKDSVVVTVVPQPVANAGTNKVICKGDTTTIGTAPGAGVSYTWSPSTGLNSSTIAQPAASPSVTTTYILTASNGTCSNKDSIVVTVNQPPVADAGSDKTICVGNSTIIGTTGVAGTTYSWSPSTGLNSSTVAQPDASPLTTATYVLTASNASCGSTKDTVIVNVVPQPTANAGPDKTICKGDTVSIGESSSTGVSYTWSPSNGLSSSTNSKAVASPATTMVYTLTATNAGCSNSDTVTVKVNPLPDANVGSQQSLCDAGTVILGAPAVAGNTYLWTPATGLNSNTISQPTANPSSTTVYVLVETDTATGCSMSNQVQVVFGGTQIYSGISPNGDGINDWWDIPMLDCYPENTVVIVNRWGSEVWSGTDYNNTTVRWAGKDMNGTDLPEDTYYYMIKYNNTEKQGWVFIKR
jgi:gliding motility-associated-like protein